MVNEMGVEIRTLTPLWTGGIEGTMDHIHETGILGSLRWWYEAIVRGLGGKACDPSKHECPDKDGNYCNVCQVFGATGWRRRFRLRVVGALPKPGWSTNATLNIRPHGRRRGWYLSSGWMGELGLDISGDPTAVGQLAALFLFLEKWGSLGARPQLGYGSFQLVNREEVEGQADSFALPPAKAPSDAQLALPNLQMMTFFRVRFLPRSQSWWEGIDGLRQLQRRGEWRTLQVWAQNGLIPISPAVKNDWRYTRPWPLPNLKPWLFGALRRDYRLRSKVNIGWAIHQEDGSWLIPGWVWLPRDSSSRSAYVTLVDAVRRLVEDQSAWLEALNLRGRVGWLRVVTFPSGSPWGIKRASLVRTWVGATLEEKDD